MMLLITERDNQIIKEWFEPYHFATIAQIEKAFFRNQQYSYDIARKRLIELSVVGYIKIYHDRVTNKNIYIYSDKNERGLPTQSRLILLDVLAEMKYCGFNVEKFLIEKFWADGKIRSDAFAIFTLKNRRYHFFVEVQLSKHPHNLGKYDAIYKSGEVQNYLGKNHFPRILFISDIDFADIHTESAEVVRLNTKLDQFPSILL